MFKIFSLYVSQWKVLLIAGDVSCYLLSVAAALLLYPPASGRPWDFLAAYKITFILMGITYFVVLFIADLYDYLKDFRQITNIVRTLIACWIGTLVVVVVFYFPLRGAYIGRSMMIIQAVTLSILVASWRVGFSTISLAQRLQQRLLIIGAGKAGRHLVGSIRKRPGCGLEVVGFVDDEDAKVGTVVDELPVLGNSSQLPALIREKQISMAVVAVTREKSPQLLDNLITVSWNDCILMDMPSVYEFLTGKLPTEHISDNWIFEWNINTTKIYYRRLKRILDLVLAVVFLTISAPIQVLVVLLIKIDSPGPIFYRQERLGQKGIPFKVLKFRTMVQNASQVGPAFPIANDSRITRVGRIIRMLHVDEVPQLVNILKGEMSFIGPRPLPHDAFTDNIRYYHYRLLVKPGVTGWAQVMYPEGLGL
ncbi:MAG: exopolysaccharide biosynthesis polyprenyl glycosylphosphotransferase, partial [Deltaproteobacteria bacterium]|nr:exopolysaccharide biosynthesis polyprenyl glycosylphosphotransferase [Deltaproteobacteria bacterium]